MERTESKTAFMDTAGAVVVPGLSRITDRLRPVDRMHRDLFSHFELLLRRLERNEAEFNRIKETLQRMETEYHPLKETLNTLIARLSTFPRSLMKSQKTDDVRRAVTSLKKQAKTRNQRRTAKRR